MSNAADALAEENEKKELNVTEYMNDDMVKDYRKLPGIFISKKIHLNRLVFPKENDKNIRRHVGKFFRNHYLTDLTRTCLRLNFARKRSWKMMKLTTRSLRSTISTEKRSS